jgi:hypothetical protein
MPHLKCTSHITVFWRLFRYPLPTLSMREDANQFFFDSTLTIQFNLFYLFSVVGTLCRTVYIITMQCAVYLEV